MAVCLGTPYVMGVVNSNLSPTFLDRGVKPPLHHGRQWQERQLQMNHSHQHSIPHASLISTKLIGLAGSHAAVHHVILMPLTAARNAPPPLHLGRFSHVSMDSHDNMCALMSSYALGHGTVARVEATRHVGYGI